MRGLRHYLEHIVNPDWEYLCAVVMPITRSQNRGARLWATFQLGILRDLASFAVLVERLADPEPPVIEAAARALSMLCQGRPDLRPKAREALRAVPNPGPGILDAIEYIEQMDNE